MKKFAGVMMALAIIVILFVGMVLVIGTVVTSTMPKSHLTTALSIESTERRNP